MYVGFYVLVCIALVIFAVAHITVDQERDDLDLLMAVEDEILVIKALWLSVKVKGCFVGFYRTFDVYRDIHKVLNPCLMLSPSKRRHGGLQVMWYGECITKYKEV